MVIRIRMKIHEDDSKMKIFHNLMIGVSVLLILWLIFYCSQRIANMYFDPLKQIWLTKSYSLESSWLAQFHLVVNAYMIFDELLAFFLGMAISFSYVNSDHGNRQRVPLYISVAAIGVLLVIGFVLIGIS